MTTFVIESPERMAELGAIIAGQLRAGDLVLLNGALGAGKTTLTRAIGEYLGIRGTVTSPTFVLARTHPRLDVAETATAAPSQSASHSDRAPLVHVDAYRLGSAVELDDLDIDFEASIVVVEWGAGLLDGVSESWLNIDIVRPTGASDGKPNGPVTSAVDDFAEEAVEPRTVTVTAFGPRWADMGWVDVFSD
ncbi:tRNA (adenosine(37)-N6)-threonylcarbamoyltransferase complex ATPase subunit type 1 TsaE [Salinibacterium sp. M195]|uniref:tRNA (adenosine(37)-N6)-threonylcarbamoyltransferase complex ATPase subunit type 1 TsaE n=1 Tax=Salinibacterium sp. M195 TaxID=2583374 RepID=UPI001C63B489|nr:tRNA (adenosine(37)-N6)-threonylcarbamoyltransferase complex ATPase subunit type 1 TsaE [Salinibacterium sp. M195]QYH35385.1 tRNA (adenosine(37)-N6)-threonylcarbamoyltransferase complex ATPase subunit type 1 TsaE [Salinibacterium sp. M195]